MYHIVMFTSAITLNRSYTHPVISSVRLFGGEVHSGLATFIVLNSEGWVMTAAHIIQDLLNFQEHKKEQDTYRQKIKEIEDHSDWLAKKKRKEINKLSVNRAWVTDQSFWWGKDGITVQEFQLNPLLDIAVGRLEPFDSKEIKNYPVFRNSKNELNPGTSLCRLGFPFHQPKSNYDETAGGFSLEPGSLPVPYFPMDGILTRFIIEAGDNNQTVRNIEISTPGLRGQSGGPIFDTHGQICGLQSRTMHYPLGFDIKAKDGHREVTDRQYLHVGIGLHFEEITKFLQKCNIKFDTAE